MLLRMYILGPSISVKPKAYYYCLNEYLLRAGAKLANLFFLG
jgi:hypothetical protein